MHKYMAEGRRGSNSDDEYMDRELDDELMREYCLMYKNGRDHHFRRRSRGKVRQEDIKEREMSDRSYGSGSSRSNSGSSSDGGGRRGCDYRGGVVDKEPGELSSDSGSDEPVDCGLHVQNGENMKLENGYHSPLRSKKRKFSQTDNDDKEFVDLSKKRSSPEISTRPPLPPGPKSNRLSPTSGPLASVPVSAVNNKRTLLAEESSTNHSVDIRLNVSSSVASNSFQENQANHFQDEEPSEDEDYAPVRSIRASRWADDAGSPADEGELSDALLESEFGRGRKKALSSGSHENKLQSESPSFEASKREGSDRRSGRSSGSDDDLHVRTSSRDGYLNHGVDQNDIMDIDDDHSNGRATGSRSYTPSEDEIESYGIPESGNPPQRCVNMLQGCRSVEEFERLNRIDEGTYGVVFRAKDTKTGEIVALKKVKMEKEREGFPMTSLREINILLSFHHPSIVGVKEVVVGDKLDQIYMVMEYMEHDLKALMETMKQPFSQSEVKCLMLQLLEGVNCLHDNWVLHRDLKTSNLLLNNRGELKICDFGLSRQYGSPLKPYTPLVVTLWYRAPELLLGAKQYSTAIDMWSVGCIMAELLSKQPLFDGKTEFDQLDKIFNTLGTPNETIWPGFSKLPSVKVNFIKHQYNKLRRKFPAVSFTGTPILSDAGFDLLNKLLTYDPEKRITAEAALKHEWFREVPLPKTKDFMPTFPAHHAQDRRTRRVMKSPDPLEELRRKELQQTDLSQSIHFVLN